MRLWNERNFARHYLIISVALALFTLVLIAGWLDSRLRVAVVDEIARTSSLLVEDKIRIILQELRSKPQLSTDTHQELTKISENTILGRRLLDLKIWNREGRVLFSSDTAAIGTTPQATAELQEALSGRVAAHLDDDNDAESIAQRQYGQRILEVYFPIYATGTQDIIAVAEIYLDAMDLVTALSKTRIQGLLLVGTVSLAMLFLIFSIVRRGGRIIGEQDQTITLKRELETQLMEQNERLARLVREAQHRNVELSDQILRRIGADLHDGPAQLLSAALLRLGEVSTDAVSDAKSQRRRSELLDGARRITQDALTELRGIAKGLVLPQLGNLHAADIVKMAIADHKQRTQTDVRSQISLPENDLPLGIKTCLFRCIQEGLNNAFRHAGGREQFVGVASDGNSVTLTIKDAGPGFASFARSRRGDALGIAGLRNRVEALGGHFDILSPHSAGTSIIVNLPLVERT